MLQFGGHCPQRIAERAETAETKSKAGRRVVGLPAELVELLRTHRAEQDRERATRRQLWTDGGWLFATPTGGPLNPRTDWTDWKAPHRAGVRDGRLHDARHTAATVLLLLGVPERAVMGVMGWSNTAMAARYQHITAAIQRDIADRVGGLIWQTRRSRGRQLRLELRLDGERRALLEGRPGVLPGQAGGSGGI